MTTSNNENSNQLKNLKYQTMLIQGNLTPEIVNEASIDTVNIALHNNKVNKQITSWNKLSKADKMLLINNYATNIISTEHSLNDKETYDIKAYLQNAIHRKKLQRNKDVLINDETGQIKKINGLIFNKQNRKFTLKDNDKKHSTLKNLAPTKTMLKERKMNNKSNEDIVEN